MRVRVDELFTKARPEGIAGKVVQFPLIRLFIAVLFLLPVLVMNKGLREAASRQFGSITIEFVKYLEAAVFFVLFIIVYRLYTKVVEKRPAREVLFDGAFKESGAGFLLSAMLVTITVALMSLTGCYRIASLGANANAASDMLFKFIMAAFLEELFFRLIFFKITEELLGTWLALLLQTVMFGSAHMFNDNATVFTSAAVAIAGLPEAGAYMCTRRVWLPLGIHAGWNYLQTGIFGMANSGHAFGGLFIPSVSGPAWFTGGAFGIEASYIAIALNLAAGLVFIAAAVRRGQIVPLFAKKR